MHHAPTMLEQSSFSGHYSFSWLEITVGGHQTTWPRRNQPEFLPQPGFPMGPTLVGAAWRGWLLAARGQAWARKLLSLRASATWVTSPCHVPLGLPLAEPTPSALSVQAQAWCSQAHWGSCWGPSAPSVSRSSWRHSAPQNNTWPNRAPLAYFQAFTDPRFSTLIFNPPSLSKPIFPNLKFPDAF